MPPPGNNAFIIRGDDGEEYGPVDLLELRDWVRENRAGIGTVVRRGNDGAWEPWQNYPELVALLAEVQVSGPRAVAAAQVVAPLARRTIAFVIDLVLVYLLFAPLCAVAWIAFFPETYVQIYLAVHQFLTETKPMQYAVPDSVNTTMNLIFAAVATIYLTGFLWAHGQTPGKALLRLRVVNSDGLKPDLLPALARSLVIVLSLSLLGLPFLAVFFNAQRRGLHDLAAGTCVVEN
jgi:uncharacterized RDD family membrane protein YckC